VIDFISSIDIFIEKVFGCGLADFEISLMIYERKNKDYTRSTDIKKLHRTYM
jgi:hypothetical protein